MRTQFKTKIDRLFEYTRNERRGKSLPGMTCAEPGAVTPAPLHAQRYFGRRWCSVHDALREMDGKQVTNDTSGKDHRVRLLDAA